MGGVFKQQSMTTNHSNEQKFDCYRLSVRTGIVYSNKLLRLTSFRLKQHTIFLTCAHIVLVFFSA